MIKLSCVAQSDIGRIRENNEDNYYVNGTYRACNETEADSCVDTEERERYLYAVCDGMGGESFGERASLIAVEALAQYQTTETKDAVLEYIQRANVLVCDEIKRNNGIRIGTTVALLYMNDGKAMVFNVGDSRVYFYRKGVLTQMSEDHTQAQQLFEMGLIEKDDIPWHRGKHRLTQHLGIFPEEMIIEPFASGEIAVETGDIFLLCSDGLTDMLEEWELTQVFSNPEKDVAGMVGELIDMALQQGGRDNITAVVVRVEEMEGAIHTGLST